MSVWIIRFVYNSLIEIYRGLTLQSKKGGCLEDVELKHNFSNCSGEIMRLNQKISYLVITFLVMFTFPSIANEESELNLGDLLTLELSTGSFLELDLKNSPVSINLIDKEDIAIANTKSLGELLEIYVPGFQLMENKWVGEIWGMRGVASDINNKFILMVNGNKMNLQSRDGTIAEMYSYIGPDVERVEVLRGPAGLVYGSGAIAGIVNIVTKKVSEDVDDNLIVRFSDNQYNEEHGHRTVSLYGKYDFPFGMTMGASGYFQHSDGVGLSNSKLFGLPHWNFPQWISPDGDYNAWPDAPFDAAGSNGKGKRWMVSSDMEWMDLRFYFRYSHNERHGAGLFFDDPYKGIVTDDKDAIEEWLISTGQGGLINHPNHLFWAAAEAWGENRRIYGTDNLLWALSYEKETTKKNKLKVKFSQNIVSEYIEYEDLASYNSPDEATGFMEQFGEKRTALDAMYLLKALPKIRLAAGAQYQFDNIGKDINDKNSLYESPTDLVVENIHYHNIALFTEGTYDILDQLTLHGGIRLDKHTRTDVVPSPKVSLIYKPLGDDAPHRFKLYYQTSSNNGSADSYEFNRYVPRDENGVPIQGDYFEDPTKQPLVTDDIIKSVTLEELHSLEPEKTKSLEFSSFNAFANDMFELETSVSFNKVENLFMWNQDYYHVFNTSDYEFGVAEGEFRFITDKLNIGINHSFTRLYKMNYEDHYTVIQSNVYDREDTINVNGKDTVVAATDWYKNIGSEEKPYYVPVATGQEADSMNAIYNMITVDNENFLNIAPSITKLYIDYRPIDRLKIHFDSRIFWSPLKGRKLIFDNEAKYNDGSLWWVTKADEHYKDYYARRGRPNTLSLEDKPVLKANIGASFDINDHINIAMGAKDIFSNPNSDVEFFKRNAMRWHVMVNLDQQDIFSSDVRSVYGKINIRF